MCELNVIFKVNIKDIRRTSMGSVPVNLQRFYENFKAST